MDPSNPHVQDVDDNYQRPEISPEDKIVSSYLEDHSETYRGLVELQNDGWSNPQATAHFRMKRRETENPTAKDRMAHFLTMCKIGDEINAASGGALKLLDRRPRVLDLCMAPGGYTASVLKHSPHANVRAVTLPQELGGHAIIHTRDTRLQIMLADITMLYKEFGLIELL